MGQRVHTELGRILGTPEYVAPELLLAAPESPQHEAAANSPAIDWWAIGVILFEMLTGVSPFADQSVEAVFDHVIKLGNL